MGTYGPDAVLRVIPNVLEDGETVGWLVEVDGEPADDLDARIRGDADVHVLLLLRADEEVELDRRGSGDERAGFSETLGELRSRATASSGRTQAGRTS